MKIIKGSLKPLYIQFITVGAISILIEFIVKGNLLDYVVVIFFLFLFIFVANRNSYNYFILTDSKLVIKNNLKPFFERTYNYNKITDIIIKGVAYRGLTLIIKEHGFTTLYPANNLKKEDLQVIVDTFNEYKKKEAEI